MNKVVMPEQLYKPRDQSLPQAGSDVYFLVLLRPGMQIVGSGLPLEDLQQRMQLLGDILNLCQQSNVVPTTSTEWGPLEI